MVGIVELISDISCCVIALCAGWCIVESIQIHYLQKDIKEIARLRRLEIINRGCHHKGWVTVRDHSAENKEERK